MEPPRPGRALALLLIGLLLPPVAWLGTGLLVVPSPGMDGYIPAFLGGMVGAVLALPLVVLGLTDLMKILFRRRTP